MLRSVIDLATNVMGARGETQVERLHDIVNRVQDVVILGVHSGAAEALAEAQLHHGVQLADSLTPSFVDERGNARFEELVEKFASCANAVAETSIIDDILSHLLDDE